MRGTGKTEEFGQKRFALLCKTASCTQVPEKQLTSAKPQPAWDVDGSKSEPLGDQQGRGGQ